MKSNNKKYFVLIILAIVLISALILGIKNAATKKAVVKNVGPYVSDAKPESYSVTKVPVINSDDKIFGAKNAKLNIFVYEDYANILSANLADTLERLKQENGDISFIVRPYFETRNILSKETALAVSCAGDKWLEMRALLFAQVKNNQLNINNFSANAKQIGLNEEEFNNCLTNPEKSRTIEKSLEEAKAYSVAGSPTMFVGDELIIGARPYDNYVDSNSDKIEGLKQMIVRKMGKIKLIIGK